ncbi:MAG: LytTR family DNA-binding domain-containing protein [Bacteroidota bacterium]
MDEFNAVIIEDDKDHMELLQLLLTEFCREVKVCDTASTIGEAKQVLRKIKPDIIFLDVKLDRENSFKILEKLAYLHETEIIVISSYSEYALEAFKHLVTDYILKPLKPESLLLAVKKARRNIELKKLASTENIRNDKDGPLKFLAIPSTESVDIIPLNQVLYLQSDGRYTIFHLKDKTSKMSSRNIGEYEKLLDRNNFFRIHHSLLANMDFAVNIHKKDGNYLKLTTHKYLPISKRRVNPLYQFLNLK